MMTAEAYKFLVAQGILGVVCAIFITLYLAEKAAHNKTRDTLSERADAYAKNIAAAAKAQSLESHGLLVQMNELRETHAIRERAHNQAIEYFAKAVVSAVEELNRIAATIRKVHERERERDRERRSTPQR